MLVADILGDAGRTHPILIIPLGISKEYKRYITLTGGLVRNADTFFHPTLPGNLALLLCRNVIFHS